MFAFKTMGHTNTCLSIKPMVRVGLGFLSHPLVKVTTFPHSVAGFTHSTLWVCKCNSLFYPIETRSGPVILCPYLFLVLTRPSQTRQIAAHPDPGSAQGFLLLKLCLSISLLL